MAEGKYDPAVETAQRLANMDGLTRDRTMRLWQDMLSKNQTIRRDDPNTSGEGACDTAQSGLLDPDRSSTPRIVVEARRKVRELEAKMHDLRLRLGELHNLIRAFSD